MKRIIIGFSKARSPLAIMSKLIMWAQGTPFSHTYIKLDWATAKVELIYQASKTYVNFESNRSFLARAEVVKEFEVDLKQDKWEAVAQYIGANLDKPYSIKQMIGMGLVCLGQKLGIKISNPYKNNHDAFICSEVVANIIEKSGGVLTLNKEDMGPKEVYNFLVENKL